MADFPLLISASLGHFNYSRSCAICQQKNLYKNKPPILGTLYNALLAALAALYGANYARAIENIGKQRKPVNVCQRACCNMYQ